MWETKDFLSKNLEKKDKGDASYVIGIEIFHARSHRILGLSQNTYIKKVTENFGMASCDPNAALIHKRDKFILNQCTQTEFGRDRMRDYPYASLVESLGYIQVCIRPDISFAVGMLGRYQSNPSIDHWKVVKKVLRYL